MAEDSDDTGKHEHLYTEYENERFKKLPTFDFNKHPDEHIIKNPKYNFYTYTMKPITISGGLYIPSYMSKSYKNSIDEIKKIDPSGVFFADLSGVTDVEKDDTIINKIKNDVIESNRNSNEEEEEKMTSNDKNFPFHNRYKKVNSYKSTQIKPNDVNTIGNVILKLIELNENGIYLKIHLDLNEHIKIPLIGTYIKTTELNNKFDIYDNMISNNVYKNSTYLKDLFKLFDHINQVHISEDNNLISSLQSLDNLTISFMELKQRIEELLKKNEQHKPEQHKTEQHKPELQLVNMNLEDKNTPDGENIPFKVSFDSNAKIIKVEINNKTIGNGTYIVDPKNPNNIPETSDREIDKIYSFVYNTGDKSIKYDTPESTPEPLSIEDGNNTFIWDIQSDGEVQVPKSLNNLEGKEIQVIIGSGDGLGMVNSKKESGKTNVEAYWKVYGTNRKNVIQIHCCLNNYEDDKYKTSRQANIDYVKDHNLQGNIVICYIDLTKPDQLVTFFKTVKNIHLLKNDSILKTNEIEKAIDYRPLIIKGGENGNNQCWLNAPLYAFLAHEQTWKVYELYYGIENHSTYDVLIKFKNSDQWKPENYNAIQTDLITTYHETTKQNMEVPVVGTADFWDARYVMDYLLNVFTKNFQNTQRDQYIMVYHVNINEKISDIVKKNETENMKCLSIVTSINRCFIDNTNASGNQVKDANHFYAYSRKGYDTWYTFDMLKKGIAHDGKNPTEITLEKITNELHCNDDNMYTPSFLLFVNVNLPKELPVQTDTLVDRIIPILKEEFPTASNDPFNENHLNATINYPTNIKQSELDKTVKELSEFFIEYYRLYNAINEDKPLFYKTLETVQQSMKNESIFSNEALQKYKTLPTSEFFTVDVHS